MILNSRKYKLISFDMFQTLADVNSQKNAVLRQLFGGTYDPQATDQFWKEAIAFIYSYFHRAGNANEPFILTMEVFELCYDQVFPRYGITLSPKEGAQILVEAHNHSHLYDDAKQVVDNIKARFETCIISDTDDSMIRDLIKEIGISCVYTSEAYRSYKFDKSGILFRKAIADHGIRPDELLHIGDGSSDVIGAKLVGADTVWLNRSGAKWDNTVMPDYEIRSLLELIE